MNKINIQKLTDKIAVVNRLKKQISDLKRGITSNSFKLAEKVNENV